MVRSISARLLLSCVCLGWASSAHADVVTDWNATTVRCVQGATGIPANRPGPVGLLDVALVQTAVHDAVQSIEGRYEAYRYATPGSGSLAAAVASASYGVLVGLYGADDPCLVGVANPAATYMGDAGLQAGAGAAAALLPEYRPTFASTIDPFIGGTAPGEWRPTPNVTVAANTFMAYTRPFTLNYASQFRPEPPPPMVSKVYAREYEEVKSLGSSNFSITSSVANVALNPRPYVRLSDALDDIVDVRIYQGIHFRSADEAGRRQGERVAHWGYQKYLRPLPGTR